MRRAVELALRFAPLDLPILLIGPSGTGKEVLAQAIHRWSGRAARMVDVNCGALHAGTVINELFGHRRGSYTGAVESVPGILEAAHRSTLFLDELNSMPMEGQRALLRVIETGEVCRVGDTTKHRVSIRLIGALQEIPLPGTEGSVRLDLVHRLAGGVIHLKPLRERPEDIWPLAEHFAAALGRDLAPSASYALQRHEWLGNVRELRNVIRRAAALSPAGAITAAVTLEAIDYGSVLAGGSESLSAREAMVAFCHAHRCDVDRLAEVLGCTRSTVYRRLQRLGLRLNDLRSLTPASLLSHVVARQAATTCDDATAVARPAGSSRCAASRI